MFKGPGEHYGFWIWDRKRSEPRSLPPKKKKMFIVTRKNNVWKLRLRAGYRFW